jgi:pyruvate/2-oxoglutarate dehydrogenase complex dihydrolipoamide dehydrogenase (E3) component
VATKAVVVANGGTASIPPIEGLDKVKYWTNRQAAVPREMPGRLLVLGGGAIGVELAQGFARLGSKVTIIEAGARFLGLEEPEAGGALLPHLKADGIEVFVGDPCVAVEAQAADVVVHLKSGALVAGDRLLVATGRRPNFEAWKQSGLVQTDRGWLKVDPDTLLARDGVYGAGDITGIGGFTHLAYYHGQIVARRLRGEDARADHTAVPRVTYTDPGEAARGYIADFHGGALKLVGDRAQGTLVGATLVTPRAGEILGELILAIKAGTPLRTLADVIHPYPAFNRVLGAALSDLASKV